MYFEQSRFSVIKCTGAIGVVAGVDLIALQLILN